MEKQLSPESALKVEIVDGQIKLSVGLDTKGVDGALNLSVDSDYLIDKLAALVPGDSMIEQVALSALKLALKSVKV